jgi:signal peptidase II
MSIVSEMSATGGQPAARSMSGGKLRLFASVLFGVVALDLGTKLLVENTLPLYTNINVIGDYVRLTFIHNPGAAFGIHLGEYSRFIFLGLSLIALVALAGMYWVTPATDRVRLGAIALICAGAIGNLMDRVRSPEGVVDFLDVGIGTLRWPVFNVADIAVTTGAIFLALSLWREEQSDGSS